MRSLVAGLSSLKIPLTPDSDLKRKKIKITYVWRPAWHCHYGIHYFERYQCENLMELNLTLPRTASIDNLLLQIQLINTLLDDMNSYFLCAATTTTDLREFCLSRTWHENVYISVRKHPEFRFRFLTVNRCLLTVKRCLSTVNRCLLRRKEKKIVLT